MPKISVYIIAYNEAEKVAATIRSVLWAEEIILVDSWSTDDTQKIAEGYGVKVVQVDFKGFGDLRNMAITACTGDWIFSLDADERCTAEVMREIREITNSPESLDVYKVPRRNYFMGRWISHSGWYPNYRQPQLFRNGSMTYDLKPVHEGYILHKNKNIGTLKNAVWQYPFKNMKEVISKINRYSTLGAEKIKDKKLSMGTALLHAIWAFVKHYVFKLGMLDGWAGFVIALQSFESTFYRYAKAIEIQKEAEWKVPE